MSYNFDILLADLKINIKCKYEYLHGFCKDYLSQNDSTDIYAETCDADIEKENTLVPSAPAFVCESLCVYRSIGEQLPQFNRFVFHGAAIEYNGGAYIFTAPSGTGKTTHINLWKENLGDKVNIINGDKPIIKVDDISTVYGTPWAGKENLQRNSKAPIKCICVIAQAKQNKIYRLSKSEAVTHLMRQVYIPKNQKALKKTLELLGKLIENVPVFMLECDISNEAFEVSYNKLTKEVV